MLARLVGTCCARQALPGRVREHPKRPTGARGSCRGLARTPAVMLPSDSRAAVAVLVSAQAALGELLPGVGGCGEVMGLAWQRLEVTWNYAGGF